MFPASRNPPVCPREHLVSDLQESPLGMMRFVHGTTVVQECRATFATARYLQFCGLFCTVHVPFLKAFGPGSPHRAFATLCHPLPALLSYSLHSTLNSVQFSRASLAHPRLLYRAGLGTRYIFVDATRLLHRDDLRTQDTPSYSLATKNNEHCCIFVHNPPPLVAPDH